MWQATLAQFACSTIATGLIAFTMFNDTFAISWLFGAAMLVAGVAFLAHNVPAENFDAELELVSPTTSSSIPSNTARKRIITTKSDENSDKSV